MNAMPQPGALRGPAEPHRLKVVVLTNRRGGPWQGAGTARSAAPDEAPDPGRLPRLLAEQGIDLIELDPFRSPLNPWGDGHPLFAGLDPLRALMVMVKHRSVDLVISVFEGGAAVPLLLRRPLFFRPPVALWDVGLGGQWRARQAILDFVLRRADGLLTLTRVQKEAAERDYRLRSAPQVIGYAVDEEFFRPDPAREEGYVLSVGEDEGRDFPTLVAALEGITAPVVLKTRRTLDIPPALAGRTRVIGEKLSYPALRALYQGASVVAVPLVPRENPSGITSLFEAMATGRAIVASDTPMVREILTDGETGVLVPVGDSAAMRVAIQDLLGDPARRMRLGQNARRVVEERLSTVAFADRFAAAVRRLLGVSAPA